jgi:HD-like signal output (HDOD) protein/CheY-like chemotaxis protein
MKRTIYVVDDQVPVMETAVMIIRTVDRQWEVKGFKDPLEALEAVKQKPPDLILSDQLMPGMQGSQLLEEVRKVSESTIRIIMSGYVPLDKLALITSAHQFIAKPFDSMKLRDTIRRSFAAQEKIGHNGLKSIATSLRSIPSLPQAHQSLLKVLEDDSSATTKIARFITEDAGLTIKVLQLANSPLFGQGYQITSVTDAIMCLGTELIAAVVLAQSLFKHYESLAHWEVNLQQVWAHSWQTAYFAQYICKEMGFARKAGEEAFLAGLMHETGRFILVDNFPNEFHEACQKARQANTALTVQLKEIFHTSPVQVTQYVLELWGMPVPVIGALSLNGTVPNQEVKFTLSSAVYVADGIATRKTPPDSFPPEPWDTAYLEAVGCADKIAEWEKTSISSQPGE